MCDLSGGAAICMDLGHLTLKRSTNANDDGEEPLKLKVTSGRILFSLKRIAFLFFRRISKLPKNYPIHNLN